MILIRNIELYEKCEIFSFYKIKIIFIFNIKYIYHYYL